MNKFFAEIIINNSSNELDRTFTYLIPERLVNEVYIGSRVLVPFGMRNSKIEGYVINIMNESNYSNTKEIYNVIDAYPLFNENMLKLIKWMKDEYICTFLDVVKTIIPTGISIKTTKVLILTENIDKNKIKGILQQDIIKIIYENGNSIEYDDLLKKLNKKSCNTTINKLIENNIIKIQENVTSLIKDKTLKVAMLNISQDEARLIQENLSSKFSAQKRVLDILIDNDYISLSDLVAFASTSYSVINSLYKKEIITYEDIQIQRNPFSDIKYTITEPFILKNEQKNALDKIVNSIKNNTQDKYLIHGVTGSGKTEVYLQAIDCVIKEGGQSIVLVPEIALTPQMVERFKSRFGEKVAVIHSKLSLGERYDEWKKIRNGEVSVAVGARSAIFAPFNNLKLIIIDEEHETSYKSERTPKYYVKKVAEKRCEIENCVLVLGSATPSVESYYESEQGIYNLIEIKNRVNECVMPQVNIIDMRQELEEGNRSIFSRELFDEISKNIENNEQSILFLNRRGHSTFISCRQCGLVLKCPNCNIALTYHLYDNMLLCHYCGFGQKNPNTCPSCASKYIKHFGIGTQKVEEEVKKLFPNASVLRMDFDTTGTKFAHQKILDSFKNNNVNILIGTQMIAKGLDFPNVTLVGVLAADISLNIDDYRAAERTFQLLTQVAGRAGRGEKQGRVVVQTYQPDNFSIVCAKNHDYNKFYDSEISIRKSLNYPPFVDIISIIISHNDNNKVKRIIYECEEYLKEQFDKIDELKNINYIIFKPTIAPLSKIKHMYRWRLLIKIENSSTIKNILKELENKYYNEVSVNIDINGVNML